MRNELLKIASRIDTYKENDYYYGNTSELKSFLNDKLYKSVFRKIMAEKVLENLDIVLKYTNQSNSDWIWSEAIYKNPNFISMIAKNLKYFGYKDEIDSLFNQIHVVINEQDIFTSEMMDAIIELDIDNIYTMTSIFDIMTGEQRMEFLKKSVEKKKVPLVYSLEELEIDFLADNTSILLDDCKDLFTLRSMVKDRTQAFNKVNEYMDNNFDRVIDSIMHNIEFLKDKRKLRDFIYYIVKDIVSNENVSLSQIQCGTNGGSYSSIIFIGDKVIKIGLDRGSKKFPNNPYIIKPLLRQEVVIDDEKMFIEITEKVNVSDSEVNEEVLYQLYKNLRDIGLVWTDIAPRNVGRLIKDNVIHWNENISSSDEVLNLEEYRNAEELKIGDFVILDADYIFDENDPNIKEASHYCNKFNERYESERQVSKR